MKVRNYILVLKVGHDVVILEIVEVQLVKEISERLFSLFKFIEELLRMGPSLGRSSGTNMLLDLLPFFTMYFKGL